MIYLLYVFTKGDADNHSADGKKAMRNLTRQTKIENLNTQRHGHPCWHSHREGEQRLRFGDCGYPRTLNITPALTSTAATINSGPGKDRRNLTSTRRAVVPPRSRHRTFWERSAVSRPD